MELGKSFLFWNTLKETLYFRIDAEGSNTSFAHFPSKSKVCFFLLPLPNSSSVSPKRNGLERQSFCFVLFFLYITNKTKQQNTKPL